MPAIPHTIPDRNVMSKTIGGYTLSPGVATSITHKFLLAFHLHLPFGSRTICSHFLLCFVAVPVFQQLKSSPPSSPYERTRDCVAVLPRSPASYMQSLAIVQGQSVDFCTIVTDLRCSPTVDGIHSPTATNKTTVYDFVSAYINCTVDLMRDLRTYNLEGGLTTTHFACTQVWARTVRHGCPAFWYAVAPNSGVSAPLAGYDGVLGKTSVLFIHASPDAGWQPDTCGSDWMRSS